MRKWQIYLPFIFKEKNVFLIYMKMEHTWSVSMAYINCKNIFFKNHNTKIAKNKFCSWVMSLLSKISFYQFLDKISVAQKKYTMFWKANATWSIFCDYTYIKKRKTKKLSPPWNSWNNVHGRSSSNLHYVTKIKVAYRIE